MSSTSVPIITPATGLTLVSITKTSVTVSWVKPAQPYIGVYEVQWKEHNTTGPWCTMPPTVNTKDTIPYLKPGVSYDILVRVFR